MFARAKKAFVGAALAAAGVLVAGWLSGHHINYAEAFDAFLTALATYGGVYSVTNRPVRAARITRD